MEILLLLFNRKSLVLIILRNETNNGGIKYTQRIENRIFVSHNELT